MYKTLWRNLKIVQLLVEDEEDGRQQDIGHGVEADSKLGVDNVNDAKLVRAHSDKSLNQKWKVGSHNTALY